MNKPSTDFKLWFSEAVRTRDHHIYLEKEMELRNIAQDFVAELTTIASKGYGDQEARLLARRLK